MSTETDTLTNEALDLFEKIKRDDELKQLFGEFALQSFIHAYDIEKGYGQQFEKLVEALRGKGIAVSSKLLSDLPAVIPSGRDELWRIDQAINGCGIGGDWC